MAITRVSGAQNIQNYVAPTAITADYELFVLQRLDNGRLAAVWKTEANNVATLSIATLDALGLNPTAISTLDSAATSRTLSLPSLASTTTSGFFVGWEDDFHRVSGARRRYLRPGL